jgi:hypothetical protein
VQVNKAQEVRPAPGLLSWLGLARKPAPPPPIPDLDIELRLRPKDPARPGLLEVIVVVRSAAPEGATPNFRTRCTAIGHVLRSFLMC